MKKYSYAIPFSRKYPNLEKLLEEPKESIILNLLAFAILIEKKYFKYLRPPPKGIYLKNTTTPILKPNKTYYQKSDTYDIVISGNKSYSIHPIIPVINISELSKTLLDSDYNIILPDYVMADKSKYLTNKPNLPVIGLSIIETVLISLFFNNNHNIAITNYLTNEGIDLYNSGNLEIEELISELLYQCKVFIGKDIHFLYDLTFTSTDVIIDKLVDVRIYEWTLNKEINSKKQNIKFLEEIDLFY